MGHTRRDFLKTAAIGVAGMTLTSLAGCASSQGNRPNILWLDAEDLSPDLACYGNAVVQTPHLDQLAAEGARFTNVFTSAPVCSPSRSAIFTGMHQTTIGAHQHRSHRNDGYTLPAPVKVITEYFREAGYFNSRREFANKNRPGKMDFNFSGSFEDFFDGTDWSERASGQPFFAHVHFSETHRTFERDPDHPIEPEDVEIPPYYPDHLITRLDWALYLETLQVLDKKVGQILQRLEDEGLAENTVVFFTGDHGRPMVRGKQWLYEGGIHIPLLVRWPGVIEPGTIREELISAIDLAPTWMTIAGIKPPDYLQGRTFLGKNTIARKYIFASRDRCDETDDRIRCVRTNQYKYIRNFYPERPYTAFNAYKKHQYPVLTLLEVLHEEGKLTPAQELFMAEYRPVEELYDLEADPNEIHNLAKDPGHQGLLKDLRDELDDWICRTGDQGQIPEDPEIAIYWDRQMAEYFKKNMTGKGLSPDVSNRDYLNWWRDRLIAMKMGV